MNFLLLGLGLDLVSVARVERLHRRFGGRFLRRFFTEDELRRGKDASSWYQHLAARLAAKEATFKALRTGLGSSWREVAVANGPRGEPRIELSGRLARRAEEMGISRFEVSLSHEKEWAAAVVLALGKGE